MYLYPSRKDKKHRSCVIETTSFARHSFGEVNVHFCVKKLSIKFRVSIMAAINPASNLLVAHVNAQSLSAHFLGIQSIILQNDIHLMALSESWLKTKDSSGSFLIPNYNLLHNDRSGEGGGGVALYVHESIKSRVVGYSPQPYNCLPEFLLIESNIGSIKVLCVVVYNPPKAGY